METIICPICKEEVDANTGHCLECDVIIESTCPECGGYVWTDNDPGKNYGLAWCDNEKCDYQYNIFMTYEEIRATQY